MTHRSRYKQDGRTTYCYYIGESCSNEYPSASNVILAKEGKECPITLTVNVPDEIEKNEKISIKYTVRVDTKDKNPAFEFPLPVMASSVPDRLIGNSSKTNQANSDKEYDIPVANIVLCDWRSCDTFTDLNTVGNSYRSSNNPQNLFNNRADFSSSELLIPKDGKYTGFVHIVVNIGGNSRADFLTFFPVQIGNNPGNSPSSIITDQVTTYCWLIPGTSPFSKQIAADLTVRTDSYCPGTLVMNVSNHKPDVGEEITAEWSFRFREKMSSSLSEIAEISTENLFPNPQTGKMSIVPVSVLSWCQEDGVNAKCSSYSGGDSDTFDLVQIYDKNLTNGSASYKQTFALNRGGRYLLISRIAMPTIDGDRIDMAVYSSVQVQSDNFPSSIFLFAGLAIGSLILLCALIFCRFHKRRLQSDVKGNTYQQPFPGNFIDMHSTTGHHNSNLDASIQSDQAQYFQNASNPPNNDDTLVPSFYQSSEQQFVKSISMLDSNQVPEGPQSFSLESLRESSFNGFPPTEEGSVWDQSQGSSDIISNNNTSSFTDGSGHPNGHHHTQEIMR
uniref:Uncharacterized protein AlNc14C377G11186 n=1 Tax=Albugo laibachii Nc14 TaxID=890382 RepID=F0WYC7_9STRA|nr:conserved hypothetical protein [Albugo laibachii Nc14]|eukprot:CCA26479.1 conserved hypothetical protein [Albugo laibachii Nc14]